VDKMYEYGMMGGYGFFGMSFVWLLFIALVAFVFGIMFWWTKKLVLGNCQVDKKKKKVK